MRRRFFEDVKLVSPVTTWIPLKYNVQSGVALHLRDLNLASNVTALLIHGVADGAFVWNEFATDLANLCNVTAVDLRGHGDSDHDPDHHYTFAQYVMDIRSLIEHLRLDEIVLVGHSMGAEIAVNIAPELGKRLRALVIVDAGPENNASTSEYLQRQLRQAHRSYARVDEYAKWLASQRQLADPALLGRLAAESLALCGDGRYRPKCDPAVLDIITAESDDSWWLPALRRTMAPVLVVRGQGSAALSRRTAALMRTAAREGEFMEIACAGHAVMTDNVAGFSRAVVPFINRALSRVF